MLLRNSIMICIRHTGNQIYFFFFIQHFDHIFFFEKYSSNFSMKNMLICNPHQVDVVRKKVLYIIINDPHSHEKKKVYISICYELFVFCHFSRFDIIIFVITVFSYLYSRFYKLFSVYEYSFLNFQLLK